MRKHLKYRFVIISAIALSVGAACSISAAEERKPNFIFFLSDDQIKADYGCYGLPLNLTPTTDKLAKEGLVFEHMMVAQAICAPSRSVLFTGQYPIRNGCFINHTEVRAGTKTAYDALKPLGYDASLAGKVHVKPESVFRWDTDMGREGHGPLPLDKIDKYLAGVKDKPFCLFVTSGYPHGPYPENPEFPVDKIAVHPHMKGKTKRLAGYYDIISRKEKELEAVLAMVDKYGLKENTVFCYSADHGGGERAKYTAYDTGLNVPFIVRWPGKVKPGRTSALTSFVDILPTFVDIAGGKPLQEVDGKSFYPVLKGETDKHHKTVFGVVSNQGIWGCHIFPSRSAHGERYHYIHNFNTMERIKRDEKAGKNIDPFHLLGAMEHRDTPEEELYDTQQDPFELVNLAQDPKLAEIKAQMKVELFKWMKQQNDFLTEGGTIPYLKSSHPVDKSSKQYDCPQELKGTVKEYLDPHKLTATDQKN